MAELGSAADSGMQKRQNNNISTFPQQRKLMGSSAQNSFGALVQAPGQVQRGSGEGSQRGGFGAEQGQVQQGSGEGSAEGSGEGMGGFWCRARSG